MVSLDSLIRVAEQIETAPISLAPERCLQRRHKDAPCRRCLDACPAGAIRPGEPVALDAERCLDCGLCLHICPTEAFRGSGNRAGKLLRVLGSLDEGDIELACQRKSDMPLSRAGVAYVVNTKACLASLSLSTLLAAALPKKASSPTGRATKIWLNDEPCQTCPIGAVQGEVHRTVTGANRLLSALGLGTKIYTYHGSPVLLAPEPRKRPVVQGDTPHYSRRAFFRSLRGQTGRALAGLVVESRAGKAPTEVEQKLPHHLPSSRRFLAHVLNHLGQPAVERIETSGLSLGTVRINEDCTACGLCARLCPSGALAFDRDDRYFALRFSPIDCLGCTICTLICPNKAVTFRPEVDVRGLVADAPQVLQAGHLAACRGCGVPCTHGHGEPLCFVCQHRQKSRQRNP